MLQSRYAFTLLFKGYRDVLSAFLQSGSVSMLDARRAEHYVASTSDLHDAVRHAGVNFAPRDACATPCLLHVGNALALLLRLRKALRRKAA